MQRKIRSRFLLQRCCLHHFRNFPLKYDCKKGNLLLGEGRRSDHKGDLTNKWRDYKRSVYMRIRREVHLGNRHSVTISGMTITGDYCGMSIDKDSIAMIPIDFPVKVFWLLLFLLLGLLLYLTIAVIHIGV